MEANYPFRLSLHQYFYVCCSSVLIQSRLQYFQLLENHHLWPCPATSPASWGEPDPTMGCHESSTTKRWVHKKNEQAPKDFNQFSIGDLLLVASTLATGVRLPIFARLWPLLQDSRNYCKTTHFYKTLATVARFRTLLEDIGYCWKTPVTLATL